MYTFDEAAQDIMSRFPFEAVKKHMDEVDWRWISKEGASVPSLDRIRTEAERMFKTIGQTSNGAACGGFNLTIFATRNSCRVALRFGETPDPDGKRFLFAEGAEFNPYKP